MIKQKKLPNTLWGEVVSTTAYVLNRCPTKQPDKVSEEVWKGGKQSVKHLRVFGSLCYKHVPEVRRKKLGAYDICRVS
jgi:hypothetical protein